jgi:hypothetical protein
LSRATFSPARHIARKTSGFSLDGPMVQMIFVFLIVVILSHTNDIYYFTTLSQGKQQRITTKAD